MEVFAAPPSRSGAVNALATTRSYEWSKKACEPKTERDACAASVHAPPSDAPKDDVAPGN
jgi:hypothetical protein